MLFGQDLTLDEFLNILKETHPIFRKEAFSKKITKQESEILASLDDWLFSSNLALRYEKPAVNFAGPEKMTSIVGDIRLSKTFWENGTTLEAAFRTGYYDFKIDPFYGIPSSLIWNQFFINYSIPLLRNRNGFLNRLDFDLKQYEIDISKIISDEKCEEFLYATSVRFLEWIMYNEQIKIAQKRREIALMDLERIQKMYKASLVDYVDVIRAKNSVLNMDQNIDFHQSRWIALQSEFAQLTNMKELQNYRPVFNLYEIHKIESESTIIEKILKTSRLIVSINNQISQIEHQNKGLINQRKPDLSAYTNLMVEKIDSNLLGVLPVNRPTAEIGIKLSVPLDNKEMKHSIQLNRLQRDRLMEMKKQVERELTSSLVNLNVQLKQFQNVLKLNQDLIESTRQKTIEEMRLFETGRGDLYFVIQSKDEEMQAYLTYAQNAFYYQNLYLQFRSLTDELY